MLKVAIVHYWLVARRGGEKVVEALCEMYPQADIFTHVYDPQAFVDSPIASHRVQTSFISRLPKAARLYKHYLPLMPLALEQLDLRGYDLVISSESGPAKGVLTDAATPHLCYCHTPMRYLWDSYQDYLAEAKAPVRALMRPLCHYLRAWDQLSANRVDAFVANSANVARRIRKHYRRDAQVIAPPVDVDGLADFARTYSGPNGYYLLAGQLVGYKRADLAVRVCSELGKTLIVAGEGECLKSLRALAGPSVSFRGRVSDAELAGLLAGCRALIFPGEEDFGIVPVEAQACGRPVIALGRGGALETVVDGVSGLFFAEPSTESLADALARFESMEAHVDPTACRANAARFTQAAFKKSMSKTVSELLSQFQAL